MMQDNHIWTLMARVLAGEASSEEADELQHLLAASPEDQFLLEILHNYFSHTQTHSATAIDEKFHVMMGRSEGPADRKLSFWRFPRYAAAAASILLMACGGWYFVHHSRSQKSGGMPGGGEILARAGARTRMILPDGTKVWLNSNSRLTYAPDFNQRLREVELEGEAYFEVTKDSGHPFIVHTSAIDVKVLGTSFAVKSYPQEETIETTLLIGAVEISRQDNPATPRVILRPNEKLIFSRHLSGRPVDSVSRTGLPGNSTYHAPDISVNRIHNDVPDSDKVETAWMYNRLVFDGDSFKEVAQKMERWFNVRITFKDERLYGFHFGGAFANESIRAALDALQLTTAFRYTMQGNEIELYGK